MWTDFALINETAAKAKANSRQKKREENATTDREANKTRVAATCRRLLAGEAELCAPKSMVEDADYDGCMSQCNSGLNGSNMTMDSDSERSCGKICRRDQRRGDPLLSHRA